VTATAKPSETQTEKYARQAREAREAIERTTPRTRAMNYLLSDVHSFDRSVRHGELASSLGRLDQGLSLGGLADVAFDGEPIEKLREDLRAYANWILLVADKAL
jgi:hypothetical protein